MKKSNIVFGVGLGYCLATLLASALMAVAVFSGTVAWPWWVVTAPIWVSILIAVFGVGAALLLLRIIGKP